MIHKKAVDEMGYASPANNPSCWLKSTLFQANEQCAGSSLWRQNLGMRRPQLVYVFCSNFIYF